MINVTFPIKNNILLNNLGFVNVILLLLYHKLKAPNLKTMYITQTLNLNLELLYIFEFIISNIYCKRNLQIRLKNLRPVSWKKTSKFWFLLSRKFRRRIPRSSRVWVELLNFWNLRTRKCNKSRWYSPTSKLRFHDLMFMQKDN